MKDVQTTNQKVLVCVWGSTMVMVDFYQVVKETLKGVKVQKMQQAEMPDARDFLAGRTVPTAAPADPIIYQLKRVNGHEGVYTGYLVPGGFKRTFRVWDGRPVYYNHCD